MRGSFSIAVRLQRMWEQRNSLPKREGCFSEVRRFFRFQVLRIEVRNGYTREGFLKRFCSVVCCSRSEIGAIRKVIFHSGKIRIQLC